AGCVEIRAKAYEPRPCVRPVPFQEAGNETLREARNKILTADQDLRFAIWSSEDYVDLGPDLERHNGSGHKVGGRHRERTGTERGRSGSKPCLCGSGSTGRLVRHPTANERRLQPTGEVQFVTSQDRRPTLFLASVPCDISPKHVRHQPSSSKFPLRINGLQFIRYACFGLRSKTNPRSTAISPKRTTATVSICIVRSDRLAIPQARLSESAFFIAS